MQGKWLLGGGGGWSLWDSCFLQDRSHGKNAEIDAQFHFTGVKKYVNSYTLTGRINCVLTTYGSIALLFLYFKLRTKKLQL